MHVYVLATCDTKGVEAAFLCSRLRELGALVRLVDAGCLEPSAGQAALEPGLIDVPREDVFHAGGTTLAAELAVRDRGQAVNAAARGAARLVREAFERGEVAGVLSLGGSAGTTIGTAAMRALPLGVPKLMISTLASGPVRAYVGDSDILMLNSVLDIAGLNRISRGVLANGAAAMTGMVSARAEGRGREAEQSSADRPLVAATMFGVTTPCVSAAREVLEEAGYEVLVFHATGNGGQALESLVREGTFAGVLDVTTTELADELVGGVLSAGPRRLTAAAEQGVPQVVSVGATDMVNFLGRATVPREFEGRRFYVHNENVTLMRTTPEENRALGEEIGAKLRAAGGPCAVLLPLRGVSAIDAAGQPFHDEAARFALFDAIEGGLAAKENTVECERLDHHINDPEFARALARRLLELMEKTTS